MRFEPFENTSNFVEDIGLFEAAAHATQVELDVPRISRVIAIADGSDQETTVRAVAQRVAEIHGAQVIEIANATTAPEILGHPQASTAGLLIIPTPFGRDAGDLKAESLGSVVDMLVAESPVPLLCVRRPMDPQQIEKAFTHIIVPAAIHDRGVDVAAGWAFSLIAAGGHVELQAVADMAVIQEAKHYLHLEEKDRAAFDPDCILQRFMQDLAGLTSAVQHLGRERSVHVSVTTETGHFAQIIGERANSKPTLIIWGWDHSPGSPQYHRGVDLVLGANGLVLLV